MEKPPLIRYSGGIIRTEPGGGFGWVPCALTQDFRGSVVSYFAGVVVTYGVYLLPIDN
jgi:hypothetical protein